MAHRQENHTVNGKEYCLTTLPPEIATMAGLELAQALGGPIEAAAEIFLNPSSGPMTIDAGTNEIITNSFAGGLGAMIKSIEPEKINSIIKKILFTGCLKKMDGTGVAKYEDFCGDLSSLFQLLIIAIRLNYKDFIFDLLNTMKQLRPQQVGTK